MDAPPSPARAAAGALLGAAAGAGLWAAVAAATGWGTGAFAVPAGALAGLGSRLAGGRGSGAVAAAALAALAAAFLGQGFATRGAIARNLEGEIAAVDRARYDAFDEAAKEWGPRVRGDEVAKFAYRHGFVEMNRPGVNARLAEFVRTTVPALEAWKRSPPPFERWQAERREEIRGRSSPWGTYLRSPLDHVSPLDLLCWILGAAAAARLAAVRPAPRSFRRGAAPPPGTDPPAPRS